MTTMQKGHLQALYYQIHVSSGGSIRKLMEISSQYVCGLSRKEQVLATVLWGKWIRW